MLVEDLFGEVAKEREVEKIVNKLHEAKTCKSFDTFEVLAKFAGTRSLTLLISPLKEVGLIFTIQEQTFVVLVWFFFLISYVTIFCVTSCLRCKNIIFTLKSKL